MQARSLSAPVAELVDATDLKSVTRKGVQVRFLSGAPIQLGWHCGAERCLRVSQSASLPLLRTFPQSPFTYSDLKPHQAASDCIEEADDAPLVVRPASREARRVS